VVSEDGIMAQQQSQQGQQHPIRLYMVVWGLLFVLSAFSYMVDYLGIQSYPRWSLIILFMILKAGLIMAIFMHMAWERLVLIYAILLPPVLVLVFAALMASESNYTALTRVTFIGAGS
jgi:cytochrome c oxidase subunit IV